MVCGFNHVLFSILYGIILPIDFHMFQDGYCTTIQIYNHFMNYGSYNPHLCWTPLHFKRWSSFSLWFHGQNLIHCEQGRSPCWLRFPPSHAILLVQRRVASEKICGHFDLPCRGHGKIPPAFFTWFSGQSPNLAHWKKEVAIWVRIFNG